MGAKARAKARAKRQQSIIPPSYIPSNTPLVASLLIALCPFASLIAGPRMSHLLSKYFLPSPSPIVLMQELTGTLLPLLRAPSSLIHTQQIRPGPSSGVGLDLSYGCGVLIDPSSPSYMTVFAGTFLFLNSNQSRGLTFVCVQHPEVESLKVLICSTHLESWTGPDSNGARERVKQVKEIASFSHALVSLGVCSAVVVAGDFNWDDEHLPKSKRKLCDPPLLPLLPGWFDPYRLVSPTSPGLTYDAKTNPMLSGGLRRRFDRILVYSPTEVTGVKVDVEDVRITGAEEVLGGLHR